MQNIEVGKGLREEFPIFAAHAEIGKAFHYLDSAASAQKPRVVIDRLTQYLSTEHANIHRGAYYLSASATEKFDFARTTIGDFLNVSPTNIIFTRGATESINLAAYSLADYFTEGDVIVLSVLEHHSNIVPWQLLAERKKLTLVFIDCNEDATLNLEDGISKIREHRPKLVALAELTNSFGVRLPLEPLFEVAREVGALTLVDACQSIVHGSIGIERLGCDFFCFSAHKIYGPTGVGVCYASQKALGLMRPFQGGGDMIERVTLQGTTYAPAPQRFEAGTPAIAEVIAFGVAISFFRELEEAGVHQHEDKLLTYAIETLHGIDEVSVYGPAQLTGKGQTSIVAFNVRGVHPHDLATICDEHGVQFRAGNHCAMPALERLGLFSTARISFGAYSDMDDLEALKSALIYAKKVFK